MSNMQTILMMAELEGHSFWSCDYPYRNYLHGAALPIDDFPLSYELNNQITEWVEFYEENSFTYKFDELAINNFDVVGKQLWQLVKEELAGKYKVVYYSEVEQKVLDD